MLGESLIKGVRTQLSDSRKKISCSMLEQLIVVVVVVSLDLICLILASVHLIREQVFGVDALRTGLLTASHAIDPRNHVLISETSAM
jgi:hypothetical protein